MDFCSDFHIIPQKLKISEIDDRTLDILILYNQLFILELYEWKASIDHLLKIISIDKKLCY